MKFLQNEHQLIDRRGQGQHIQRADSRHGFQEYGSRQQKATAVKTQIKKEYVQIPVPQRAAAKFHRNGRSAHDDKGQRYGKEMQIGLSRNFPLYQCQQTHGQQNEQGNRRLIKRYGQAQRPHGQQHLQPRIPAVHA